jgi:hypothetical protein
MERIFAVDCGMRGEGFEEVGCCVEDRSCGSQ